MCGILGLYGEFQGNDLISMMKVTKRRGMDGHGIYLSNDSDVVYDDNIDLDSFSDDNVYNVGIGHNLLSISNFYNEDNLLNLQPKRLNNLVLSFNGEIYNYKEVLDFLKSNLFDEPAPKSDCELLIQVLNYYYNKRNDLTYAIEYTNRLIDGDYAYVVYDGENIAFSRDPVGVKPLYYGANDKFNAFASEKRALWAVGITDIKALEPGHTLSNFEDIQPKYSIHDYDSNKNHKYETYKKYLDEYLNESVRDRIVNIDDIGLLFSGGLDSTLLLYYIMDNLEENQSLRLYSVGNENSKDVEYGRKIAESLNVPFSGIVVDEDSVRECLDDTLLAIGEANIMKLGVGMTVYLASQKIHEDGIKVALSGQGADELFSGYKRYLKTYEEGYKIDNLLYKRYNAVEHELRHDIQHISEVNLERDDAASMANTVELRVPYLSEKMVKWSLNIPAKYKINGSADNIRKHILRELAIDKGVPKEIAYRKKKAAQYGSGIDKILRRKIFKRTNINKYFKDLVHSTYNVEL